jgi:hypothetical protein
MRLLARYESICDYLDTEDVAGLTKYGLLVELVVPRCRPPGEPDDVVLDVVGEGSQDAIGVVVALVAEVLVDQLADLVVLMGVPSGVSMWFPRGRRAGRRWRTSTIRRRRAGRR